MKKDILFFVPFILIILFISLKWNEGVAAKYYVNDSIPIQNLYVKYGDITSGQINQFKDQKGKLVIKSKPGTNVEMLYVFKNVMPIGKMQIVNGSSQCALNNISIQTSFDNQNWNDLSTSIVGLNQIDTIPFQVEAKYVKLTLNSNEGCQTNQYEINKINFLFGEGYMVEEATDWTNLFHRYEGWTGSDGIYSMNLNGKQTYSSDSSNNLFIFGDTFIGQVDKTTNLRMNDTMINNTYAVLKGNQPIDKNISFYWRNKSSDYSTASSVFDPSGLTGYAAINLVNGSGLSDETSQNATQSNKGMGTMWLSGNNDTNPYLIFDFKMKMPIYDMWVWNYNEDNSISADLVNRGIKGFKLYYSDDKTNWTEFKNNQYPFVLTKATGDDNQSASNLTSGEPVHFNGLEARYIKLVPTSNYGGSAYDNGVVYGLSEVGFYNQNNLRLFTDITASSQSNLLTNQEQTSRYWLQTGFIYHQNLYLFPIVVKNNPTTLFEVDDVNMLKIPVKNGNLDINHYQKAPTPFYYKNQNETIIFGNGVLNLSQQSGLPVHDGYIYIYGYQDIDKERNLVVTRVKEDQIEDFNQYEYWNGTDWTSDISQSKAIASHISTEFNVMYMQDGIYKGKYMLTYMKDTISGYVCYAVSSSPVGPFNDVHTVYYANVSHVSANAYTYNAKAQPNLSKKGEILISYNVNTYNNKENNNGNVYHPRFIRLIEVGYRNKGE